MQTQIPQTNKEKSPCLLFFDIDGTILDEATGLVSDNTKNAIQQAQTNGHMVFINSGRGICCIEPAIKEIGFDGYICGCGTHIQYNGQVLLSNSIDKILAKEIIEDIQNFQLDALLEGSNGIYFSQDIQAPEWKRLEKRQINLHNFPVSKWDDPQISFDKFCLWKGNNSDFTSFYNKYQTQFEFIDRDNSIYEVVPLGFSKATGIQFLMEHLHVPYENTFGLGDSSNDLPMLEFVKNSIAMGNCTPLLRDIVSFITKDVDQDGIEFALQHYQLI